MGCGPSKPGDSNSSPASPVGASASPPPDPFPAGTNLPPSRINNHYNAAESSAIPPVHGTTTSSANATTAATGGPSVVVAPSIGGAGNNGLATSQQQMQQPSLATSTQQQMPAAPLQQLQQPTQPSSVAGGGGGNASGTTSTNNTITNTNLTNGSSNSNSNKKNAALHIGNSDAQWKDLWDALHTRLLDPADLISVVEEIMNETTNRLLLPTEINFVIRRVRHVVSRLPPRANNNFAAATTGKMRVFSSSSNNNLANMEMDGKSNVEKHRLISSYLFRRILGGQNAHILDSIPKPDTKEAALVFPDPIEAAYTLLLHLSSDPLIERAAAIAVRSAEAAGLTLDVNEIAETTTDDETDTSEKEIKGKSPPSRPSPPGIPKEDIPDLPSGISLQSYTYLLALALRGSRQQRLQLLFYILLPPKTLEKFLATHPGGAVPFWLLEVDSEVVFSLASMTHYQYYGHSFLPANLKRPQTPFVYPSSNQHLRLKLSANGVQDLIFWLIKPPPNLNQSLDNANHVASPNRKTPANRRGSNKSLNDNDSNNPNGDSADTSMHGKTEVMEKLEEVAEGRQLPTTTNESEDPLMEESRLRYRMAAQPMNGKTLFWSMEEFAQWADQALDDLAIDVIMHRLFATGILPTHSMEKELVQQRWMEWQSSAKDHFLADNGGSDNDNGKREDNAAQRNLTVSARKLLESYQQNGSATSQLTTTNGVKKGLGHNPNRIWGGIGGFDGRAAMGFGVMYCIDKNWWDAWEAYVGWSYKGSPMKGRITVRPRQLSTECLVDRNPESYIGGIFGSFEVMKQELKRDVDYILIPQGVWDVLYELYGGGPPLPRPTLAPEPATESTEVDLTSFEATVHANEKDGADKPFDEQNDEKTLLTTSPINRIPRSLNAALHPWLIHAHLCDPQQPYRRGDVGPLTIRVMVCPDQPLWRALAEIIVRLPLRNLKAYDSDGRGRARLWKKTTSATPKDPNTRFGPWSLLCKNRFAKLPSTNYASEYEENYDELREDWEAYADKASVEGSSLVDGDYVLLECAVMNNTDFVWPREAAAKAGRVRRLAAEDMKFRQLLRGVDENGETLENPQKLVGMMVDAMDSSGRWYQVEILKVENVQVEADGDGEDEAESGDGEQGESKQIKVDFSEFGGHIEWIDTESDRLATAERFTQNRPDDGATTKGGANNANSNSQDTKTKPTVTAKKSNTDSYAENGKVCLFPGYGACGLTNLGNTCYINSAIQCISYMPLFRAYLLSSQYKTTGDLNKDNPLGTGGKLLEEFADLLRLMWGARYGEKSPSKFRALLGKNQPDFSGADQQDAQEFLNYILDKIHEDSNRIRQKPIVPALEDDWVKATALHRVEREAWRRFLRRDRSIMADVAMGQQLSTTTCPVCQFSSRKFDPFNLLIIPIPTVEDVIFSCTVIRRATTFNCPWILNKPRKGDKKRSRFNFTFSASGESPPSEQFVAEQYIIPMSRLADSSDLKVQIRNACGIPAENLRLGRAEEVIIHPDADSNSVTMRQTKVTPFTEKDGPCSQLVKQKPASDDGAVLPTQILAFETTLKARPAGPDGEKKSDSAAESAEDDEEGSGHSSGAPSPQELKELEKQLEVYGDEKECRIFDTDPFFVAKAVSRSLWPRSEFELKLGLRVDAIDHRGNWFPGSVVELVEGAPGDDEKTGSDPASATKVRVHFDNFSTKWDELYTIEHFTDGKVRPLYSHSTRRAKPTEFIVHHRFTDNTTRLSNLFGQSFYVQCQNEWSTARAGAHILSQATRFLQRSSDWSGPIDLDDPGAIERDAKVQRLYERTHSSISDLIDLLVDCDREYVRLALGISEHNSDEQKSDPYRNPSFDATTLSTALVKKVANLLHRLPFEVRVCTIESTQGNKPGAANEEVNYPFSLMRTIGNYMNARHAVVLQWKEPPSDKKGGAPSNYLNAPVMYVEPNISIDATSANILKNKEEARKKAAENRRGSGGMHLGVCLSEFCKVQKLSIEDNNWRCPRCKDFREANQNLDLWRLPDLLTINIKRFNCSARWNEKISAKVNFPLTGLDMSKWCHEESPAVKDPDESSVYDLVGVMNHYGSMTGGHYVAICKATACGKDGREEVAHNFNGAGATSLEVEEDAETPSGWRISRPKAEAVNHNKVAAGFSAKSVAESAEPLWLQFDDDLVEPVPPQYVVSENAYVLFYRRRRLTPSNIAKYSTLE